MAKDTITQPKLNFVSKKHIDSSDLPNQKERREFAKISEAVVKVQLSSIAVRKGFNVRENFEDIPDLAESILSLGLLKPLLVDILTDGTSLLTDGERRYRALKYIIANYPDRAKDFEYVLCQLNDRNMDDTDRLVAQLASNTGKPFDPMEEAEGFRRLRDGVDKNARKMTITDIAKSVGKSIPYVEQRLILADASDEEKEMMKSGQIKPTAFVQLTRETRKEVEQELTEKAKNNPQAPSLDFTGGDKKEKADNSDIPRREDNTKSSPRAELKEDAAGPAVAVPKNRKPVIDKKVVEQQVSEKRKQKIKKTVQETGKRVQVKDVKPTNVFELAEDCIKLCRELNKLVDGGKGATLIFELDGKLREIKKSVKK